MEFPTLGKQCSVSACKRLDFLPVKCNACEQTFCNDHYLYQQHQCPESYKMDNQVPVCPLCNHPVSCKPTETPDLVVGRHIDSDCQSETAQHKRKIYDKKCSVKGCKQKELVPVKCETCQKNFCLRHRHEMDHDCKGFQDTGRPVSNAGAAAVARHSSKQNAQKQPQTTMLSGAGSDLNRQRQERLAAQNPRANDVTAYQMGLSEDEALKRALAMSLSESQGSHPTSPDERRQQEEADAALARALYESEKANRPTGQSTSQQQKSCEVS